MIASVICTAIGHAMAKAAMKQIKNTITLMVGIFTFTSWLIKNPMNCIVIVVRT